MLANQTMSNQLYTATPREEAQQAYARMVELKVRHMPVIDGDRLVGLLSDRDMLLFAESGKGYAFPKGLLVETLMAKNLITAPPETPISRLAQQMLTHQIDAVPIVRADGQLLGLVTASDLLRLIAQGDLDEASRRISNEVIGNYAWELAEDII